MSSRLYGSVPNGPRPRLVEPACATDQQACRTILLCTHLYCPRRPFFMYNRPHFTTGLQSSKMHQLYRDSMAGNGDVESNTTSVGCSSSWQWARTCGVSLGRCAWASSISCCASVRCRCLQYSMRARSRPIHSIASRQECA